MSTEFVKKMLLNQRKRVVGSIMNHAEATFYAKLTRAEQLAFRQVVLSSVGVYHDTCLDMVKSSVDDGSVLTNEDALVMLTEIHARTAGSRV